jgi:ABC-2 type transport system permease protein
MRVITTLMRKHLLETRWQLGLSVAAFFGLSLLTTWMTRRFERLFDSGELTPTSREMRPFMALGGPQMDFSTTALEVAGEIERGTVDVTLSRPVSRSAFLTSQILFAFLGLVALAVSLISGLELGSLIYSLKAPPTVLTLLRPATMVVAIGLAVFGYTMPFSTMDVVRWRPNLVAAVITLGGLIAMTVAPQFEGYEWLERLSVFRAYAPVTVALKGEPLAYNATALLLVFLAGSSASYVLLARRDLPSNS